MSTAVAATGAAAPAHYPRLIEPELHPDWQRRSVRPPTWATFGHRTQFTTLRSLTQSAWREDLERYTETFGLGRVIWPMTQFLWSPQVGEVIEEIRRRGLFLFDLWSHVPGSPMFGVWSHITPPPGMVEYLQRTLGDHFLGLDNGEQDGRYVGGYAPQQCPNGPDGLAQYLNFQRHFQQLGDDLGNHLSTLVSLSFGHYFLKEGNHVLIGAETAQALPNNQVYYAFIRGAGRQYGVPWFGNASVFNRWGWKSYEVDQAGQGVEANCGPEHGSSLSLLKRLLYTHYLYNCVAIGFESGWLRPKRRHQAGNLVVGGHTEASGPEEYELTPIGTLQAQAAALVERCGQPGVMHAPVALLLDFFAGWSPPRHLYTSALFQRWGSLPWGPGDWLTHGVLGTLYPGYEDASYYHDERGFLAPTPFGDMADCLLSDAPEWVLGQYGLIVVAGELQPGLEIRDRLRDRVHAGGCVWVTGAPAVGLVPGLALGAGPVPVPAGVTVSWPDGHETPEPSAWSRYELTAAPTATRVLARVDGAPVAIEVAWGAGRFVVCLAPMGLNDTPRYTGLPVTGVDQPLPAPFVLLDHVAALLAAEVSAQQVFVLPADLAWVTCRRGPGEYTVGVCNNNLHQTALRLAPRHGGALEVAEVPLGRGDEGAPGYWPGGGANPDAGADGPDRIAGGSVRLFQVQLSHDPVVCLPPAAPPPRPQGRWLALRGATPIQTQILARPTFFQHFDGVKIDWTWLLHRDPHQLGRERDWLLRQGVRLAVDFSSGLNQYPGLTLIDAYPPRYQATVAQMDEVLAKLVQLGGQDAILGLHRGPENHLDGDQAHAALLAGLQDLCRRPANRSVCFHLHHQPRKGPRGLWRATDALALVRQAACGNLRFALHLGHWAMTEPAEPLSELLAAAGGDLSLVLLAAPGRDAFGQVYDAHEPFHRQPVDLAPLAPARGLPWVLDACYDSLDDEYRDSRWVWP